MMKQRFIVLLVIVFCAFSGGISAQENRSDSTDFWSKTQLRIGYGNFPQDAYETNGARLWPQRSPYHAASSHYLPYMGYYFGEIRTYGSAHAGFVYEMNRRWNMSLNLLHSAAWASVYRTKDASLAGSASYQFYEAALTFQYQWVLRDLFQVYSGVGAHVTMVDSKVMDKVSYTKGYISLQFVPIGISYGKEWFGFAEWGVGHLNILQVGVGHRF